MKNVANLTPLKAIRKYCLWCANGSAKEVRLCPAETCAFWRLRFGKGIKGISNLKTIRKKCLDCSAFSPPGVRNCPVTDCDLFMYRFGHNPRKKGQGPKRPLFLPSTISTRADSAPSDENTGLSMPLRKAEEVKSTEVFKEQGIR